MVKSRKIIINDRIVRNNTYINTEERDKKKYELLKNELKNRIEDDIRNKINTMKILLKIKNGKLYILDGYKRFEDFIFDFKIAKTQAYKYIKIAKLIFEGKLEEIDIIENGIDKTLFNLMKDKKIKSKVNLITPLRIRLETQEACDFYKRNLKFTSYLLEDFYQKNKEQLIKKLEKYKNK
ncbi:chromosome replication/partitioning protein (plasmid) [Borrelia sp. CA_690]|uniref:Chromosome replication/partitioning protein n=1 Tax=Borrelia maritima TaxID=2761123 RepID=A0A5J6WDS5_9SPIR|nr:chromosome replication/partitioning protein [Borrelia maritima]QFI15028.1 chromosome replication/partitioning protein [Borrelia maritima]